MNTIFDNLGTHIKVQNLKLEKELFILLYLVAKSFLILKNNNFSHEKLKTILIYPTDILSAIILELSNTKNQEELVVDLSKIDRSTIFNNIIQNLQQYENMCVGIVNSLPRNENSEEVVRNEKTFNSFNKEYKKQIESYLKKYNL